MGYQESFIHIENLAEAAGHRDAIKAHPEEAFYYYCATRAKKDMYLIPFWIAAPQSMYEKPFIHKDELFTVVGGDRRPYQTCSGMIFTDYISGLEQGNYSDFFDDLDDSLVDAEAAKHPESRKRAKDAMDEHLDRCWDYPPSTVSLA